MTKKGGNKAFGKFCIFLFHPFIAHLTDTGCKLSLHIYGYIHGCILHPLNISSTLQFQKSPFSLSSRGFASSCHPHAVPIFSLQCMYVRFFLLTFFAFSPTFVGVACSICISFFLLFFLASVITVGRGKRKRAHYGVEVRLDNLNKTKVGHGIYSLLSKRTSPAENI